MKHQFGVLSLLALAFGLISACSETKSERIPITTKSEQARDLFREGMALCERFHLDEARVKMQAAIDLDHDFALGYLGLSACELSHGAQSTSMQQADELSRPVASKVAPSIVLGINVLEDRNKEWIGRAGRLQDKVSPGERLWIQGAKRILEHDLDGAAESFEQLASMYPNDPLAHRLLGDCYLRFDEPEKAIAAFHRALGLDSTQVSIYNLLGYEYQAIGKDNQAEQMLKLYAQFLPDEPNPFDSYGEFLLRNGRYDESLASYRKALEIDSTFMNARVGIATNLMMLERYEEARHEIRKQMLISQSTPELDALLLVCALSFLYQNQPEQSLEELTFRSQYLNAAEDPISVAHNFDIQGEVLSASGKYIEAETKFLQSNDLLRKSKLPRPVVDNFNMYHDVRLSLYVDIPQEEFEQAEKRLHQLEVLCGVLPDSLNRSRLDMYLHICRGVLALEKQNYKEAVNELRQSSPRSASVAYYLGVAYEALGQPETAADYYHKATKVQRLYDFSHALVHSQAKTALARLSRPIA